MRFKSQNTVKPKFPRIRLMSRWRVKSIQSQCQSKHTLPNTHRITFTKDKRLSIFCLSWDTLFATSCVLLRKKIAPSGNKCGNIFLPFPLIFILLSRIGWLAHGTLQLSNSHSPTHESLSCRCSLPGRPTQDTKLDYNKSDWHLIYTLAHTNTLTQILQQWVEVEGLSNEIFMGKMAKYSSCLPHLEIHLLASEIPFPACQSWSHLWWLQWEVQFI